MQITLSDRDDKHDRAAVMAPLDAHNDAALGADQPWGRLAVLVRDATGAVEGGMVAIHYWQWLKVEIAWLPEERRRSGLGGRMLATLEHAALARGCRGVWLSTFSVQAPGFYLRHGYREFARIAGRPVAGEADVFFARTEGLGDRPASLVVTEAPDPAIHDLLLDRLVAWTDARLGPRDYGLANTYRVLAVLVRDAAGRVLGGLWGWSRRGWAFVELFGLPPELRGQGMGTRVLRLAEDEARARGCVGIWLDTMSFQARPFYEKLGFQVFGQLADYPTGHARYFLMKRF